VLPLVERDAELERIHALLLGAKAGESGLLLLDGPAGIGKTRLLTELRREAARDRFRVLAARGAELEADFPFGVARQLLEPALVDEETRERWLAGAAQPAAALLAAPAAAAEPSGPGDPTFALLHGLYWAIVNAASDGPLVLAVDDLQWCDRPSLRFLAYLLRRIEGLPVLLAATQRSAEPGTDAHLLAEIANDPATVVLSPQPLTPDAVGELAGELLTGAPDPTLAAAAHDATGGNPLLVGELLHTLRADGDTDIAALHERGARAVSRTVMVRLGRLDPAARTVAEAVAVLGDGAELPEVAALADLPEDTVATATGQLARVDVLRAEPPLGFVHPLVREAIYREIPSAERELRHERAARLRRERHAPPERIAAQLLLAPRRGERWAIETLHEAGRSAMARGGLDAAVGFLRRALDEAPGTREPGLLVELGMAEALGAAPDAVAHLGEAYDLIEDPSLRSQIAFVLARTLLFTQDPLGAARVARDAAGELPPEMVDERLRLESAALLAVVFGAGTAEDLRTLEEWRDRPLGTGVGGKMLATIAAFAWGLTGGPADGCARLAVGALDGGDLVAADNGLLSFTAMNVLTVCEHPDALRQWELALADAHQRGSLFSAATAHMGLGYDHLRRGDLPGAEDALRTGLSELRLWGGAGDTVTLLIADLCTTVRERGDVAGARAALELADSGEEVTVAALFRTGATAELLLAEGRAEDALEAAMALDALTGGVTAPAWVPWRSIQARALLALGRPDEAVVAAEDELPRARAFGAPGTVGHTLRTLGVAMGDDGLDTLDEAVAVLEGSAARLELAKALHAQGATLRRLRRPSDAREPLRRAVELATACGAEPLAAAARTELHAAGGRPRRAGGTGPDSLTPSERRVADLAAAGGTNREIAQGLFVTPKTVEVHLSSVYRKLGIASRRELERALAAPVGG
jgi:DNA-binding CsgD family transcriptional regulator/tetratricopeptide (TPR) repeat protein